MTLRVRDTCLCLHLQRAARAMARHFDLALKPAGLTNGQFSLLMSLNRPNLPGVPPATMASVANLLGVDRTTLTAAVKTLRRRSLIRVQIDPTDRRGRTMTLTPAGHALLALATPIWVREHTALEAALAAAQHDPAALRQALTAVSHATGQPVAQVTTASANPS